MTTVIDADGQPVTPFRAGDTIPGNVQAVERLGVGHRCETWLAWSPELWCPVVAKFPRPHQTAHPRARTSLGREVAALDANLHPALPRLHADGTASGIPFVLLEHVDGLPLDAEVDDHGAMATPAVVLLALQLLAAVRTVHRRGWVHTDIKPENVILRDARPVLIDFGSARRIGAPQPPGRPIGTPGYAAPELETGGTLSAAADVFGIGVTLHEAATARPAYDAHLDAIDRPQLARLDDGDLAPLVAAMTEPDPVDRIRLDDALLAFSRLADPAGEVIRHGMGAAGRDPA